MALTMLNHFCFENQELRIPCLLLDSLVIYGLTSYESKLQKEKAEYEQQLANKADQQNENEKRDKRAQQVANRAQQKAEQRKLHNNTSKHANFGNAHNIQQPDKAKKI